MADLSTTSLGLKLKNPLIIGSSGLTNSVKKLKAVEQSGAGALVLKSLFEEQVYTTHVKSVFDQMPHDLHTEAFDYIQKTSLYLGANEYLDFVRAAKKEIRIPIIGSVHCISDNVWIDYARKLENAGVDALELNFSLINSDVYKKADELEEQLYTVLSLVKQNTALPLSVKLGPYYTSLPRVVKRVSELGVKGVVLFNRYYPLDIDIESEQLAGGNRFSDARELCDTIRWVSILSGKRDKMNQIEIIGSRGVHDGSGVIKLLLAGAQSVQVCSSIYINSLQIIGQMLQTLENWMDKKGYRSLQDFRGKLSQASHSDPKEMERMQFIKAVVGIE